MCVLFCFLKVFLSSVLWLSSSPSDTEPCTATSLAPGWWITPKQLQRTLRLAQAAAPVSSWSPIEMCAASVTIRIAVPPSSKAAPTHDSQVHPVPVSPTKHLETRSEPTNLLCTQPRQQTFSSLTYSLLDASYTNCSQASCHSSTDAVGEDRM